MSKKILPKSIRIHIRRQKSFIRKQGYNYKEQKDEIRNLYKKFIVAKNY